MSENEYAVDVDEVKDDINKAAGEKVAYNLNEENPVEVPYWIPTGSKLLDAITSKGDIRGIPGGRILELAGLPSTGKSFLAATICSNAQELGVLPVYLDSEHSGDIAFLEKAGVDLDNYLYVQAKSVEFVFERVEDLIGDHSNLLFVWDSIAQTPVAAESESDYDPRGDYPQKPSILSDGFERLQIPLANADSTLLTLNQLRDRIPRKHESPTVAFTDPYKAPGGHAKNHTYALRIWLTRRNANNAFIEDENENIIGAEVNALIKKSKFGTERKECNFDIMWGDEVKILDEESWVDAVKHKDAITVKSGGWGDLEYPDGSTESFRTTTCAKKLKKSGRFRERFIELIKQEKVQGYRNSDEDSEEQI